MDALTLIPPRLPRPLKPETFSLPPQHHHLPRPHRQALRSGGFHRVVVLDPHAETVGNIDSGFDRLDVAGGERLSVAVDEIGLLVAVHAQSVAEAMREVLAVAGVLDDFPRRAVHVFARGAR